MSHVIPDAVCILRSKKAVYRQAKVYQYKGGLYAGHGGGFVRLFKGGGVGTPDLSWDHLDLNGVHIASDSIGRLVIGGSL